MADIKSRLLLDNSNFNKNAKQSTTLTKGLKAGLGALGSAAKVTAVAVTTAAVALTALVTVSVRTIDRLGKVAKTTGFAAETLQKFQYAAELSGVGADQAAVALRRFSRRLGEAQKGTGELLPALKKLGIDTRTSAGTFKSAEQILFEFADGIAKARNESESLSLAFKAFDSEGAELVETMKDGADGLRAFFDEAESLGFILNTSAIAGVEKFADEFYKLRTVLVGVVNQFTAALAPTLEYLVTLLRNKVSGAIEKAGGTMEGFGIYLKNQFIEIIAQTIKALEGVFNTIVDIGNAIVNVIRLFGAIFGVELFPSLAKEGQELINIFDVLDKISNIPNISNFIPGIAGLKNILVGVTAEVLTLEGSLSSIGEGELFKKTDKGTTFANMLLGNLEENKQAAKEIVDIYKDVPNTIVTAQQTLLQKVFGIGQVRTFWENWEKEGASALERFGAIASLVLGDELVDAIKNAFANSDIGDFTKTLAEGLVKGVEMFEDALADAIVSGKADFSALGDHLKQTLAKAMVQKFVTGPIMALFGLAKGGPAKAGQPYIVGEEGPELFVPGASGTVVPNNKLANTGTGVNMGGAATYITNISAVDTQSFQQAIAKDPEFIFNVSRAGGRRTPTGGR